METRRDVYRGLAWFALILVFAAGALFYTIDGVDGVVRAVPGLVLVIIPALLAWRCDVRHREERRHEALMKALLAIHRKLGGGSS
ncbi:MAG: hypothetical protein HRF48_18020 [Chloroflexota bacterium]|jgi:F0F1-type ATP synthase assembly protein I